MYKWENTTRNRNDLKAQRSYKKKSRPNDYPLLELKPNKVKLKQK